MNQKTMVLILGLALSLFAINANAIDVSVTSKELLSSGFISADVKEISKIPNKPHFLLGLEPKVDEWEKYLERRKIWMTKDLFYGYNYLGIIDKSRNDYIARGNTEIFETITMNDREIKIIYTHHHITKGGMHTFWSPMGEKNLAEFSPLYRKYEVNWALGKISDDDWKSIKRLLGWAQFEAVKSFVHRAIEWGVAKNVKDYSEMNLTNEVLAKRSVLLSDPDYAKKLDETVPGSSNLKVRDLIPVPLTRPEDFLPDLLIVGPRGFYGGFANWKTPGTERIVFLDILGLALWYTTGWSLPAHEFVHTNPYLQGTPLDLYFDVEMWAALTTDLNDDLTEYLFHQYLSVVRHVVKTYWGYDHEEAARRIFAGSFGVRDVREKEFRENAVRVKQIRDELLRFIKDPKDGFMVTFYTDPYFWITANTKFCDTSAVFQLLFATKYEPAGIYDSNKKDKSGKIIPPVIQTKEWLAREEEAGKIKRLAEKAMAETGKETEWAKKNLSKVTDSIGQKCPVHGRFFFMNEKEQQRFAKFIEPLIDLAKNGDKEAQYVLMRIFAGSGSLSKVNFR